MALKYGFVKCKIKPATDPYLKGTYLPQQHEKQYHLHATLLVETPGGTKEWDSAVNVGTNDADDLLNYKLVYDYHGPLIAALSGAGAGQHDLTGTTALPALDFLRSAVLAETGPWKPSDGMNGSESKQPYADLKALLVKARDEGRDVYIFGRFYTGGDSGLHDIHMNQGSGGKFINNGRDDHNDHNDVWQDGAVLVDQGEPEWAAYFTAFTQQKVPTDRLGNPTGGGHGITDGDDGSMVGG